MDEDARIFWSINSYDNVNFPHPRFMKGGDQRPTTKNEEIPIESYCVLLPISLY